MKDEAISTTENNTEKINKHNSTPNLRNSISISKELLFFKNDILKDIKNLEIKINDQKHYNTELENMVSSQDKLIFTLNNKIDNMSNIISDNRAEIDFYKEKFKILLDFKTKTEENLIRNNFKIKLNSEDLISAINKYDKIIADNLLYPGNIGQGCKFRDFHQLFDYVLNELKTLTNFKDKTTTDFKTYKTKLDSTINSLNYQIASIIDNANSFCLSNIKELEKKFSNEIKLFEEKILKIKSGNIELLNNIEKEKKQIFKELKDTKNMKKELIELINSSIEKVNISNNEIQKNYEKQIDEIKNNITSINEIYDKNKKENLEDMNINSTKSEYYKNSNSFNEKNIGVKRIQSAKSDLQNYIEGNSLYQELIEKNRLKCKQHEYSQPDMKKLIMKKYYDEGINNRMNLDIIGSVDNVINNNNLSLTERNRLYPPMNTTPKTNTNLINKESQNDIRCFSKNGNLSKYRKYILIKEGEENYNDHSRKKINKSKEQDKRLLSHEKFTENIMEIRKIANIKQLGSVSFLYNDIKKKKIHNIEKNGKNKTNELITKEEKSKKLIKDKTNNVKYRDYDNISGFKSNNENFPKTQKIAHRISSPEITKYYKDNEDDKNSIININNTNYENLSERYKLVDVHLMKQRKNSEFVKKPVYRLKAEKNKK